MLLLLLRRLSLLPVLALAVGLLALVPARGADNDAEGVLADELKLKNAYLQTDGKSLVTFLSTRARGDITAERLGALIDALGAKTAAERQKACGELVAVGSPAIPHLRMAARSTDSAEAAALARRCLKALEEDNAPLTAAAVRILAARRPEGTGKALLAYLPHAENDTVLDELKTALAGVAYVKGKPDPDLIQALDDEQPVRRAHAIMALCASGIAEPRAKLRKLLSDPAPSVRLRASLALAQASDSKAVSTLILLLADLPQAQATEVESYLVELAGDLGPKVELGSDQRAREKARDAWAKWWLDTEGPGLLDELRKRTLTEDDMTKALALIEKLGDDAFSVRQKAESELKKMGANILPLLKQAQNNKDVEIRTRAADAAKVIEVNKPAPLSPVAARLIALRKPKEAAERIVAFMPFADDDGIAEEMQVALNAVAYVNGKAHPAVVKALADKSPARRSAAAVALCNGPLSEQLPAIRKLLKDPDADVRLRVALALAGAKEPEAVPVLIKLVAELPTEGSAQAEEYLVKLARDGQPKDLPEGDDNRKKRGESWQKWYDANQKNLVMVGREAAAPRERYLGYTILCRPNESIVSEWDKDRKVRWQITGLMNPWDAHVLRNNRVLIAEYNGMRVTERNFKGEILWQKATPNHYPMQVERLRNGNTFIVCTNLLLEVNKSGREVLRIDRPQHDVRTARKLPNGQIAMISSRSNELLRLDGKGKQLKAARLGNIYYNQNEILDNGNVLVPGAYQNNVIEYNADGKEVWRATVQQAMHATKLPNGNVLVVSQTWPYKLHEFDKKGKQVSEYQTNTYVYRARRR